MALGLGGCSVVLDFDRLREGRDAGVGDLADADLTGADLTGADLVGLGEVLAGVDLTGVDQAGICPTFPAGGPSFVRDDSIVVPGTINADTLGLVDVDHDGLPEALIAFYDSAQGKNVLRVYKRVAGAQTLAAQAPDLPGGCTSASTPRAMIAGDYDGDGLSDLVVSCDYSGAVELNLLLGKAGGGFAPLVPFATASRIYAGASGDLDGDHYDDYVGHDSGGDDLVIYWGGPTASAMVAAAPTRIFAGATAMGVTVAPILGGRPAIAAAYAFGYLKDQVTADAAHLALLYPAAGARAFASLARTDMTALHAALLGRYDADPFGDLLLVSDDGGAQVRHGDATGALGAATGIAALPPSPGHHAIADLDCDGRSDVVTAHNAMANPDVVTFLRGATLQSTNLSRPSGSTSTLREVFVADLDGDRRKDIVVLTDESTTSHVRVYFSQAP